MNIRTRFLTFLAAAAAVFTGCQQQEADFDLPSIKIEGSGITVDNETKKASYSAAKDLTAITLSVTATRDWKAEIECRSQDVKVTILDNPGYNRAKQIKFNINYDYKTLYITQSGEKGEEIVGTLENPFTVAGVNKYVKTLGSDVQSPNEVYIKGKISQIADAGTFTDGGTFGNATFYISDDGSTSPTTALRTTSSTAIASCTSATRSSSPARLTSRWATMSSSAARSSITRATPRKPSKVPRSCTN